MKKGKLIKISEDHYVVVDNSKIKEGDWYENNGVIFKADNTFDEVNNPNNSNPIVTVQNRKIILTTKPLVDKPKNQPYKELILSEVEELINGYSVEKIAEQEWGNVHRTGVLGYIDGFKAHQELTKNKLFTFEDMRKSFEAGELHCATEGKIHPRSRPFIEFVKFLLPKTEWDIEIEEQTKITLL